MTIMWRFDAVACSENKIFHLSWFTTKFNQVKQFLEHSNKLNGSSKKVKLMFLIRQKNIKEASEW